MNTKTLTILIIILTALTPSQSKGQTVWSLQQCIDHALEKNIDIRRQRLQAERSGNELFQSYANIFPSLNAGSSGGMNFGRNIDEVTNEVFTQRITSQNIQVSSSYNLFAGFRNINNIRYNLSRHTAFKYDTGRMENDIILAIANAYLQVLYFKDMAEVSREQLEVVQQQLERTRILLEGGTVSRGAVLDMEATAAGHEETMIATENQLELSYLELMMLLELDPSMSFAIERPDLQVDEVQLLNSPDQIVERALLTEPGVLGARERISMAEKGLAITRGQRYPTLTLNASLGTRYSDAAKRPVVNNPGDVPGMYGSPALRQSMNLGGNGQPALETIPYMDQLNDNYYRAIQLSLYIPLFNQFNVRTNVQNSRIDLEQSKLGYQRSKNDISRVINHAHADAQAAYQQYISATKTLEAAIESFRHTEQSFNLGVASTIEYNEARVRADRARINALQSMYEFVFMTKILEFYQGKGFTL